VPVRWPTAPRCADSTDGPSRASPQVCASVEEKAKELPPISGNPDLVRRVWEQVDVLGNDYIWQLLLSF